MTAIQQMQLGRDLSDAVTYSLKKCYNIESVTLQANSESNFTVPSSANNWELIFGIEPGSSVWVAYTLPGEQTQTATIPSSGSFSSGNSELNPGSRIMPAGTVVSCITNNVTVGLSVIMYSKDY